MNLPTEQFDAIIFHEEGHIVLGHEETTTANELAADAYAASRVGKAAMKSALNSLFTTVSKFSGCTDIYQLIAGNPRAIKEVESRFAALS